MKPGDFEDWYEEIYQSHKDGTLDFSDQRITQNPLRVSEYWLRVQILAGERQSGLRPRETAMKLTSTADQKMDIPMFIRELFQNAYDVRPKDANGLIFEVKVDDDGSMTISHNGTQFKPPTEDQQTGELTSLFHAGATTKDSSWDSEGQFGIGFKGWVTFFQEVRVSCVSKKEEISVAWKVKATGYHAVEGGEAPFSEMKERNLTTSFRFSDPLDEKQDLDAEAIASELNSLSRLIASELNSLSRFRADTVTVRVIINKSEIYEIKHRAEEISKGPKYRILSIENKSSFDGEIETEEKMLGVEIEIEESNEISNSIQQFIDYKDELFKGVKENPWKEIDTDSWYGAKRICVGVILDSTEEERLWLHRMAAINSSEEYITKEEDHSLNAETDWVIDGPFWLDHTRQKTNSGRENVRANANMLEQAISRAAPILAKHMAGDDHLRTHVSLVNSRTPFDKMIRKGSATKPDFSRILYFDKQTEPNLYGHPKNLKEYSAIFKEGGIHQDSNGHIIEPNKIRTVDPKLEVCEGNRLVDWINDQTKVVCWDDVPVITDVAGQKIATDEDSAFLESCPYIPDSVLLSLLDEAELLVKLLEEYPKVDEEHWYAPNIDADKIIISEGEMPYDELLDALWEMVTHDQKEYGFAKIKHFQPDDPDVKAYMPEKKGEWAKIKRKYAAIIPQEDENERPADRWIDLLLDHYSDVDGASMSDMTEDRIIEIGELEINKRKCSWFYCQATVPYWEYIGLPDHEYGFETPEERKDATFPVLIKKKDGQVEDAGLCVESLNAWTFGKPKKPANIWLEPKRIGDSKDERRIINHTKRIVWPHDSTAVNAQFDRSVFVIPSPPYVPCSLFDFFSDCSGLKKRSLRDMVRMKKERRGGILLISPVEGQPNDSFGWNTLPSLIYTTGSESDEKRVKELERRKLRGEVDELSPDDIDAYIPSLDPAPRPVRRRGIQISSQPEGPTFGYSCEPSFTRNRGKPSLKNLKNTLPGRSLQLHLRPPKEREPKRTTVIIQDLGLEFLAREIGDETRRKEITTITEICENSYSGKRRISIARGVRKGKSWEIRNATVLPVGDPRALQDDLKTRYLIADQGDFDGLRDNVPASGFVKDKEKTTLPWVPSPMEDGNNSKADDFLRVRLRDIPDNIVNGDEKLKDSAEKSMLHGISIFLGHAAGHIRDGAMPPEHQADLEGVLSKSTQITNSDDSEGLLLKMSQGGSNITPQQRESLKKWLEGMTDPEQPLASLLLGLQQLEAVGWKSVMPEIMGLDTPAKKWEHFLTKRVVEKGSVHKFDPEAEVFLGHPNKASFEKAYDFVDKRAGKDVFHISIEANREDATRWGIDHRRRLVILDDGVSDMLDAEEARSRSSGRFAFEPLKEELRNTREQEPRSVETLLEHWGFFQCILGIWERSISGSSESEPEGPITAVPIKQDHKRRKCKIFDEKGPEVRMNTRAWDLAIDEETGRLTLYTANPSEPTTNTLQNIDTMLSADDKLRMVMQISLRGTSGVSSISGILEVKEDEIRALLDHYNEKQYLNPLREEESGEWLSRLIDDERWQTDHPKAIKRKEAKTLLKKYTKALKTLLRRGEAGPASGEELQKSLSTLVMSEESGSGGRGEFERQLYPQMHSMLADEPRINVSNEASGNRVRRMFIVRRYQQGDKKRRVDEANLSHFPGNIFLYSSYSQNLAKNYSQEWGLLENPDLSPVSQIRECLRKDAYWGHDDHLILRGAMISGNQELDLKIHKYHAITMLALEDALEDIQSD